MSDAQNEATPERPKMATLDQTSAGGVVVRQGAERLEVVIVAVGNPERWQLPKGIVDVGEVAEVTALREVREEAGIHATLVAPLDPVEYWYVGSRGKQRVRFHKRVYFYLMAYVSGQTSDHDHEVNEARWVGLDEAQTMLAFKGERRVVAQATTLLAQTSLAEQLATNRSQPP